MAVVRQVAVRVAGARAAVRRHPRLVLVAGGGTRVELPAAPVGGTRGGAADRWETLDRPGRQPLVVRNGDGLPTLAFTVAVGYPDPERSVEPILRRLRDLAGAGARVTVAGLSAAERGPWRLADLGVSVTLRQYGTNDATRADVSLSLVAASDVGALGPLSGGHKQRGGKGRKLPTRVTAKKGDTLRSLSARFYGTPAKWRLIARANKIRDPKRLKAGTRLRIPKEA